jgi:hypothetical protein
MEANAIREVIHAAPFRPFRLHLADGRTLSILHPEFIHVSPQGRRVLVFRPDDDAMTIVEPLLIVTLETIEPASAPGANGPAS